MSVPVVVDVARLASAKGKPGGALSGTHPVTMLSHVLRHLVERNNLDPALVDDVIAGCVQQVGEQAWNVGRYAVLGAGFPESIPATTINRQCGSSQQAVHFAAQGIAADAYDIVIACGVESMSRVPMGVSIGNADCEGPEVRRRYPRGLVHQGVSAELVAAKWKLTREELDEYAVLSHTRAARASSTGFLAQEIVPITIVDDNGNTCLHESDETVRANTTLEQLRDLRPAFKTDAFADRYPEVEWLITPGNSSPLTDGASAALLMSEQMASRLGLKARARFVSYSVAGDDPELMLTAPIPATNKVLERAGLGIHDIDAYEVNEAFAPVPLAWARELAADPARLNPRGGAIALGHALGSSGTRLLGTLLLHLEHTGGRYGLQTMCEATGMANATVIERL